MGEVAATLCLKHPGGREKTEKALKKGREREREKNYFLVLLLSLLLLLLQPLLLRKYALKNGL